MATLRCPRATSFHCPAAAPATCECGVRCRAKRDGRGGTPDAGLSNQCARGRPSVLASRRPRPDFSSALELFSPLLPGTPAPPASSLSSSRAGPPAATLSDRRSPGPSGPSSQLVGTRGPPASRARTARRRLRSSAAAASGACGVRRPCGAPLKISPPSEAHLSGVPTATRVRPLAGWRPLSGGANRPGRRRRRGTRGIWHAGPADSGATTMPHVRLRRHRGRERAAAASADCCCVVVVGLENSRSCFGPSYDFSKL